jgi:hypothetical protein
MLLLGLLSALLLGLVSLLALLRLNGHRHSDK